MQTQHIQRFHGRRGPRAHAVQQPEVIGRLASGLAHDLNVVLMAILSNADLLSLRTSREDPRQSYIDEIRSAVMRGSGVARRLSAFKRQTHVTRVDVNRLIGTMTAAIRRVAGSAVAVSIRLSADDTIINADPAQLEQMLLTLTINARDAIPAGGCITIATATAFNPVVDDAVLRGEYVRISVAANGNGTDATAPGAAALSTVRAVATRHGGMIEIESLEGQRFAVNVFLPSGEAQQQEDADAA